jgi:hypothetical protein
MSRFHFEGVHQRAVDLQCVACTNKPVVPKFLTMRALLLLACVLHIGHAYVILAQNTLDFSNTAAGLTSDLTLSAPGQPWAIQCSVRTRCYQTQGCSDCICQFSQHSNGSTGQRQLVKLYQPRVDDRSMRGVRV